MRENTKSPLLVRVAGIEPASFAWEANVLPLYYTRKFLTGFSKNIFPLVIIFKKKHQFYHPVVNRYAVDGAN